MVDFFADNALQEYLKRGEQCILYGKQAADMDRDELLAFIGVIDEYIERLKSDDD